MSYLKFKGLFLPDALLDPDLVTFDAGGFETIGVSTAGKDWGSLVVMVS